MKSLYIHVRWLTNPSKRRGFLCTCKYFLVVKPYYRSGVSRVSDFTHLGVLGTLRRSIGSTVYECLEPHLPSPTLMSLPFPSNFFCRCTPVKDSWVSQDLTDTTQRNYWHKSMKGLTVEVQTESSESSHLSLCYRGFGLTRTTPGVPGLTRY